MNISSLLYWADEQTIKAIEAQADDFAYFSDPQALGELVRSADADYSRAMDMIRWAIEWGRSRDATS